MKRVVRASVKSTSSEYNIKPQQTSRLLSLIEEFNNCKVNEAVYESVTVCRIFDSVARDEGLKYGVDFMCPPFQENCIVKLSDCELDLSGIDEDLDALANGNSEDRKRAAANPNTPPHLLEKLAKDRSEYVRHKVATNPSTPHNILEKLANDRSRFVSEAATKELE